MTLNEIIEIANSDLEFPGSFSSNEVWYGNEDTARLTDVIADIAEEVLDKADANHSHSPASIGAASSAHVHTQSEITGLADVLLDKANVSDLSAKADLVDGKVPASQLPAYVDDVLEYDTVSNFPTAGESGKIYVDTTANKSYRWSGSVYVEISASIALGETSATAYRGDRGKIAYDHSQNGAVHVTADQKTAWDAKAAGDHSHSYNELSDKPVIPEVYTHPAYHPVSMITGLSDVATSGSYDDLTNKPTIPEAYVHPANHPASMITGLSDVATSGSYNDLSNKPVIPEAYAHPDNHPASMITGLADVATSGSYNDLSDKPSIPTIPASLPANGGNADTVDGKHASDFAAASHTHNYAASSHTHSQANITGLTDALATKANVSELNAKADLVDGKIPASQLPAYVDDVLEYNAVSDFPATGESGKIYVAANKTYRWTGSGYVEISPSIALGETASTAYRGDRGKIAYDHSQNGAIHVTAAQKAAWDAKSNFSGSYNDLTNKPTIPTVPSSLPANGGNADTVDNKHASDFATANHTHGAATTSAAGLMSAADKSKLDGIATGANKYTHPSYTARTGVPTANQTPGFGGTFTVSQPVSDATGHITAVNSRTITIPSTAATTSAAGLMSAADKSKLDGIATGANKITVDSALSSTSTNPVQNKVINTALAGKAASSHTHAQSDITGLAAALASFAAVGHNHNGSYISTDLLFTNAAGGVEFSYGSGATSNLLTTISGWPQGLHTAYVIAGTNGAPPVSSESWRMIAHKTDTSVGWILAFGSSGSIYSNYQNGANSFRGWRAIYDYTNTPLWSGAAFMQSLDGNPQTITPSKKLSECRTGWMLLWSDYDTGTGGGVNDSDFCTTLIPKRTPSGGTWDGKAFYCDIPMFAGSSPTDLSTEQRCIKPIYVHDNCLKGSYQNTQGGRNDVVLRAVYEF